MNPRYATPLGALLLVLLASAPASAATCTWKGGAGAWQTPSAWSCNAVPGSGDDVVVGSGAVTFSALAVGSGAVTVRSLTLTGGTLDGDGTVTVTESLVWEAGTMAGPGSTIVLGTAEFRDAVSKNVARTVYLRGASTWSNGTLQFRDGGVLVNEGSFTDDAAGTHSIARAGSFTAEPVVLNRGTWTVASVGTSANVAFVNAGTLRVAGAGFRLNAPGRFENADGGTLVGVRLLDLASGPAVQFGGQTQPGGAGVVGAFPVEGPVPMAATHVLDVDLAGPGAHDQLVTSRGAVAVDGRLLVRVGSAAAVGAAFPVLVHTGPDPLTGCYEPDEIDVRGPGGVTPAPYAVAVTCSASGVQIAVSRMDTAGEDGPDGASASLALAGPNPFAGRTALALTAPAAGRATVEAFDALGRRVAVLFEGAVAPGQPVPVAFEAGALPVGLYVVRAAGEGFALARTVTLAR